MKRFYLLSLLACSSLFSNIKAQTPFGTIENLDINYLKVSQLVHGDMWWNPAQQMPACEYPKGSGKYLATSASLWMGGFDPQASLKVSAQTYRQNGNDFWPGPIDSGNAVSYAKSANWAKIWKVKRSDIESFKNLSSHTTANTPAAILEWPAKGNPYAKGNNSATLVIQKDMAPFVDVNSDGVYNPLHGDYPKIKGDEMLWWVFNDYGPTHNLSQTAPMQLEVQSSAYAYAKPGMLSSIAYYEYQITNRSQLQYDSFVLAVNADMDLGNFNDDFIGFDSAHRMGIVYNANAYDNVYGNLPPIAGVTFIEMPGDNPVSHQPAGSFMYYNNGGGSNGNPANGLQMYYYMTHSFLDGSPLVTSCNGMGTGTTKRYIFDGDPHVSASWSECGCSNLAGDRRFVIASNAFRLTPGSTQKIAFALLVDSTGGGGCANTTFTTIKNIADSTWIYYYNPPTPTPTNGISNTALAQKTLIVYPNPAHDKLYVTAGDNAKAEHIRITDALGRSITLPAAVSGNTIELNTSTLSNGVYTITYTKGSQSQSNIFVKD